MTSLSIIKPDVSDFKLEILNVATGQPLLETIIGDRNYIAATNERFSIRITHKGPNFAKYIGNGMYLTLKCIVDGVNIGYASLMVNECTIIDYRIGPCGRHALQFAEPEYIKMDEGNASGNKKNVDLNKTTEIGTIKVELWQTTSTGQLISFGPLAATAAGTTTAVHDTKKFFDKPNVATAVGEALGGPMQQQGTVMNYIKKWGELKIWIQTPLVLSVLGNNEEANRIKEPTIEENESLEQAESTSLKRPVDELPVKSEKKFKHEDVFDLTNDED